MSKRANAISLPQTNDYSAPKMRNANHITLLKYATPSLRPCVSKNRQERFPAFTYLCGDFNNLESCVALLFLPCAHNTPSCVYELPILGGPNSPLGAIPRNKTFFYISVPEISPLFPWPDRMGAIMKEERRIREKGKGKSGHGAQMEKGNV